VNAPTRNEVGTALARGRARVPRDEANEQLSAIAGESVQLPPNAIMSRGPSTCPACGSGNVMWGCDQGQLRQRDQIHPLVWHETQWMADSFICRECWAGWIEPDDPAPITWVRPYWLVS
jgi:hypothetical protein